MDAKQYRGPAAAGEGLDRRSLSLSSVRLRSGAGRRSLGFGGSGTTGRVTCFEVGEPLGECRGVLEVVRCTKEKRRIPDGL